MSSIDNRIVKMGFENSQFKQRISETIGSLGKLESSLKLTNGIKGLGNIANAAKSVDMSTLSNGVETVRSRLSAMEIVGVTALVNLSNSAINAGKNFVKSLTVEPVMDGLREYETKMQAIQTILTNTSSKGTTLDDINGALIELNEYSDQTIYNFAQMTDNIGKMTAAGLGLDDATKVVKGLSNVAAGFGVDATRMAGATYQMSQALSAGVVRLQDWNSLQQAGMGGEMIQQELIKTAEAQGVYVDQSMAFRDTLQSNWLSADIFVETMGRMAEDPSLLAAATNVTTFTKLIGVMKEAVGSGWAMSWEHILGDKEQSTALFTSISNGFSDMVNDMSTYRNEALKTWNASGGREAVLNGLKNILTSISKILTPIYNSFRKIIDPWNSDRLIDMSKSFEWLTSKLIISDKASDGIGKTFDALFTIVKALGSVLQPVGLLVGALASAFVPLISIIPRITGFIAQFATGLIEGITSSSLFTKTINFVKIAIEKLADALTWLFDDTSSWLNNGIALATDFISKLGNATGDLVGFMANKASVVLDFGKAFLETHQPIEKVKDALSTLGDVIGNMVEAAGDGITAFCELIKTGMDNLKNMISSVGDKIKNSGIEGIDIFNAGIVGGVILLLVKLGKTIKSFMDKIAPITENISGLLGDVRDSLEEYQNNIKADKIKKIAISVMLLSTAILILSKVDPDRLLPSIAAVSALLVSMMGSLFLFSKIDAKSVGKASAGAIALVAITVSLNILATALKRLSNIDTAKMLTAVLGLAAVSTALIVVVKMLDKATITPSQGAAMILLATSLTILAGAFKIIASIDVGGLVKGVTTLSISLAAISVFIQTTKGINNTLKVTLSLIPLSIAMINLAGAIALFGLMNPGTLLQGCIVIGALLLEMSLFTNSLKSAPANMLSIGAGLVLLSTALIILSGALAILGNMDIMTIAQGMLVMGASLLVISKGVKAIPIGLPMIATGLLVLSVAMIALSGGITMLSLIPIGKVVKGLLVLASALLLIGGASILLSTGIPFMAAFAIGIAGIAVAIGLFGGAALVFAMGVSAMAASMTALGAGFAIAIAGILAMIPLLAGALALAFVSFFTILGANAEALGRALTQLLISLMQILTSAVPVFVNLMTVLIGEILKGMNVLIPQIVEAIGILLTNLVKMIVDNTPLLLQAVMDLIMSVLKALRDNLPKIVSLVMETLISLIESVLTKLSESIPRIARAFVNIIISIIDTIATETPRVVEAMFNFVIKVIDGLTNTLADNGPRLRTSVKNLVRVMVNEFVACIGDFVTIGGDIIGGVVRGVTNGISNAMEAIRNVGSSMLNGLKNILGIHSPSREFKKLGLYSTEGLAIGISDGTQMVVDETDNMADEALSGVKTAMGTLSDLISDDIDCNPVITPVLDLSNIQNGSRSLDSIWSKHQGVSVGKNMARRISGDMSYNNDKTQTNPTVEPTQYIDNSQTHNTFDIKGSNPKQIAQEVSKIIQTKIERKKTIWA